MIAHMGKLVACLVLVAGLQAAFAPRCQGQSFGISVASGGGGHHHHHGHHHHAGGGQSIGQTIDALLTSGTQGANVDSTSNADGSSTTTISYADGSKVALTTPAGDSGAGTDSGGTNSGNTNSGNSNYASLLEQLIRLQAQVLSVSSSQSLATSQTLANV